MCVELYVPMYAHHESELTADPWDKGNSSSWAWSHSRKAVDLSLWLLPSADDEEGKSRVGLGEPSPLPTPFLCLSPAVVPAFSQLSSHRGASGRVSAACWVSCSCRLLANV